MSDEQATIKQGRDSLTAWQAAKPDNFFRADPNFQRVLEMHLGEEAYHAIWPTLDQTGAQAATAMDQLASLSNRDENLPLLRRYDGIGKRVEEITFHTSYIELGAQIWSSGVLAMLEQPGNELSSAALTYLIAHNGEAGHLCPVACTAGVIKLLQRVGSDGQKEAYLPLLLERDYSKRLHAAQFITEIQGGSDVGANGCVAIPDPESTLDDAYRIYGEKWFCSVIDAGVFLVSARPRDAEEGTKGLGLFLVPRTIHNELNAFSIRRLKYKLGTRSMASGEADFDGAHAEPVGLLHRGFKNLISIVLDTSRVYNAVVACGAMRRAFIEAQTFARHRTAFGPPIIDYPLVARTLARIKALSAAATASTFRVLALSDRLATDQGDDNDDLVAARRTLVNINKYWTSVSCSLVVRDAIEVLGGNGTIEEFSVLPRLYRDAIVLESWEGTHNTLCAQVLRDFAARGLHRQLLDELHETAASLRHASLAPQRERLEALLKEVTGRIDRLLTGDELYAALHIRQVVDRLCLLNGYLSLLKELQWELDSGKAPDTDKAGVTELFYTFFVAPGDPMEGQDTFETYKKIADSEPF
jgi:alkylation response protein AidB-like acyl-CoA dehydrogenase